MIDISKCVVAFSIPLRAEVTACVTAEGARGKAIHFPPGSRPGDLSRIAECCLMSHPVETAHDQSACTWRRSPAGVAIAFLDTNSIVEWHTA